MVSSFLSVLAAALPDGGGTKLCSRCSAIHLSDAFSVQQLKYHHRVIAELGSWNEMKTRASACDLCRTLVDMTPIDIDPGIVDSAGVNPHAKIDGYQLRAFKAAWVLSDHEERFSGVVLGVTPKPMIWDSEIEVMKLFEKTGFLGLVTTTSSTLVSETSSFGLRRLDPKAAHLGLVRGWLAYCTTKHGALCSLDAVPAPSRLKVLNCQSRQVVSLPQGCNYTALSYLWGEPGGPAPPTGSFEKVIEDSMDVTRTLGYDYIWIDRLCIDQAQSDEKKFQIGQMDLIYAHAALTIVAAAGDHPSYGLPGVHGKKRTPQPGVQIGNKVLASNLPDRYSITTSAWDTRGWTYQESKISRKRLIFTDHQIIFDCNSMRCTEALRMPLDLLHGWSGEDEQDGDSEHDGSEFDESGPRMGMFDMKAPGSLSCLLPDYINEYSRRNLRYLDDKLNAILGILQLFRRSKTPVFHFWGVPLYAENKHMYQPGDAADRPSWTQSSRFAMFLFWELQESDRHMRPAADVERSFKRISNTKTQFPSWSWTGWEDAVMCDGMPDKFRDEDFSDVKVWLQDEAGNMTEVDAIDLEFHNGALQDTFTSVLRVSGWTLPVSLVHVTLSKEQSAHVDELVATGKLRKDDAPHNGWHAAVQVANRTVYTRLDRQVGLDSYLQANPPYFMLFLPQAYESGPFWSGGQNWILLAWTGSYYERLDKLPYPSGGIWWSWNQDKLERYTRETQSQWERPDIAKKDFFLG